MQLAVGRYNDTIAWLDNGLLDTPGLGTCYLVQGDDLALIETGASPCVPYVLDGLRRLGIDPARIRHVLLTHIHMDHAGATGTLLPHLPEATVYIHSRTARFLVDPRDLLASAERALGPLFALHGVVEPVPAERIVAADELRLDLGRGVVLRAIPSPGHSPDHLAYFEEQSRALFAGDALGVAVPAADYVGPVTPPPGVSVEAQRDTFARLQRLPIDALLFAHFGPAAEAPATLIERLSQRYDQLVELVWSGWQSGALDRAAIVRAMLNGTPTDARNAAMIAGWIEMSINGLTHYFDRQTRQRAG